MSFPRLRDMVGRADQQERPVVVDSGEVAPGAPWSAPAEGVRVVRHYGVRPGKTPQGEERTKRDPWSGPLLVVAALVIAASAIGAGYVSYGSQKLFSIAHLAGVDKGHHRASIIAALPDAGWIAMAMVGLVASLRGRSSFRARLGVLLFFGLSLAAQVLYAPRTPEGDFDVKALLVAVIAPIALAWMLETFIVEVRYWAALRYGLDLDETPILSTGARGLGRGVRAAARFPLWLVRLGLDWTGTKTGMREWVLDVAPLAPGRTRASMRADEAVARAGTAEEIADQARKQAAALIEQARADSAQQVAQIRTEAEQVRTQTGQQTELAHRQAAEQVEQVRAQMTAQLAELTRRHEAQLADQARQARAHAEQLVADKNELADQVDRMREELELLSGTTTAKARLHALYEQLGRDGDPRYLDRTKIRELAAELAPRVGMRSIGTADNYIRDYIATKTTTTGPVQGRGAATNGAMIVNGA